MDIEDFIKLSASEAGGLYRHHRDAGDAEEASRLHQAYYEAHRVRLSDDRQLAEAQLVAAPPRSSKVARKVDRSKVRRVGVVLSTLGLAIGLFAAAAGVGAAGLIVGGGLGSSGFALWLVGILEDQLISVRYAIEAR
ncbi:hypothetical protein DJ021_06405 [Phenylobacterium hankyongense]|uniref:Uncharacterized protein n=1 Tax=Phenylobacterium hankyongense TaxID=1813876 RepID=A0A328AZ49_9CAUL|nr:hypothetical protein [Phenylobacterium hankyongense]RAK59461.1 hypothetical protein DJ021_06405 [Phenylobacterium hankyongense]